MVRHLTPSLLAASALIGSVMTVAGCQDLSDLIGAEDVPPEIPPAPDASGSPDASGGSDSSNTPPDAAGGDTSIPPSDASGDGSDVQDVAVPPVGCNGALACERVVFVTSAVFSSDLGGLTGADAKCQALADAAGAHARVKGRAFRAWLSTAATPAAGRHPHGTAKYIRPDDIEIASSWTDLVDGTLTSPIAVNEKNQVENNASVWTGSDENGASVASGTFCNDWTVGGLGVGWTGRLGAANATWSNNAGLSCAPSTTVQLYCVEY